MGKYRAKFARYYPDLDTDLDPDIDQDSDIDPDQDLDTDQDPDPDPDKDPDLDKDPDQDLELLYFCFLLLIPLHPIVCILQHLDFETHCSSHFLRIYFVVHFVCVWD